MTTSRLLHERMREKGYSKIRLQKEYMQYFQLKNYRRKPGSVNLLLKKH